MEGSSWNTLFARKVNNGLVELHHDWNDQRSGPAVVLTRVSARRRVGANSNSILVTPLADLYRWRHRGRDVIDHAPRQHDDNAVAGALVIGVSNERFPPPVELGLPYVS